MRQGADRWKLLLRASPSPAELWISAGPFIDQLLSSAQTGGTWTQKSAFCTEPIQSDHQPKALGGQSPSGALALSYGHLEPHSDILQSLCPWCSLPDSWLLDRGPLLPPPGATSDSVMSLYVYREPTHSLKANAPLALNL